MTWLRRLFAAESGSILAIAALSLTTIIGMAGLGIEVGNGYTAKVRNQRVADMAALGAALAYRASNSSVAAAQQVAQDIVVANGLPSTAATVNVPVTVNGSSAIQVQVTTSVPVKMLSLLTRKANYSVTNSAAASIPTAANNGCVTVLSSSSTSVVMSGGTTLTANNCSVTSNGTVALSGGAKMTALQVVAGATSTTGGASITTTPAANNIVTKTNGASDTIVSTNTSVQTALCYVNKINGTTDSDYVGGNTSCSTPVVTPTAPSGNTSSADVTFTSGTPTAGYAAFYSGGTYTLPAGPYTFRNIKINGGVTVNFGNSDVYANSIDMSGSGMTIGNGKVYVWGTFGFNSGSTITIGNGAHYFGSLAVTGGRNLVVGSGNFTVQGSITEGGGSTIKIAISADDTVTIGGDGTNTGSAISLSGGSSLCFTASCAAPTAAAGTFSVTGDIKSAGGSMLILPKAVLHVISGDIDLNGSSTMGSGQYIIGGNFTNNAGGTMTGSDVSFILGGNFTLTGGTSLDLAAPSTSSGYGIQDILVATKSTSSVTLGGGTTDKYSGMVYAPKAQLTMSGGSSLSGNGSQCLMLMVDTVKLTGGAAFNTNNCPSLATAGGGKVALIQ